MSSCRTPVHARPGQRPRRSRRAKPIRHGRCCRRLAPRQRPPRSAHFEARSHGPRARYLRFTSKGCPSTRKTRFWLLARLCQTGLKPAGSQERFPVVIGSGHSRPPLPGFAHRTAHCAMRGGGGAKGTVRHAPLARTDWNLRFPPLWFGAGGARRPHHRRIGRKPPGGDRRDGDATGGREQPDGVRWCPGGWRHRATSHAIDRRTAQCALRSEHERRTCAR